MHPTQARMHTVFAAVTLQLTLLLPTLMHLIACYYMKEPYHTSLLSGYAWQLAIFLYTSVTGLSLHHVGERFQRANGTISK